MATNQVQIEITAIDKAGGVLDKIQVELKQTAQAAEKSGKTAAGGMNLFGKSLGDIKSLALGVVAPVAGIGVAIGTVKKLLVDSVNDWADYNEEIRKFSIATGAAPEDISRLMQAADDLGVSMSSLGTAFSYASRNGVTPTISNIANLSDELLAIKDPAERAQVAMKIFGRGWVEVAPFILAGSDAIRDGTAAINENMVATKQSIEESRAYKMATDNLADSWTGLKNTLARDVIPTATEGVNVLVRFFEGQQRISEGFAGFDNAVSRGIISLKTFHQMQSALGKGTMTVTEAQDRLNYAMVVAKDGYYRAGAQLVQLNRVEGETISLTGDLADSLNLAGQAAGQLASQSKRAFDKMREMEAIDVQLKLNFDMPLDDIDQQVKNYFDGQQFQNSVGPSVQEAFKQIVVMDEIDLIPQASIDKMYSDIFLASQKVQLELGLINTDQAAKNISEGLNVKLGEAYDLVKKIKKDANFVANATINVRTNYIMGQSQGGDIGLAERLSNLDINKNGFIGRASGGPVMPGQTYLVGEQGKELFVPQQAGTIVPNSAIGGGVSYSFGDIIINAGGGQSPEAIARALINQINRQTRASRNAGLGYVS